MRLTTRLWIHGAVLPATLLAMALLVTGVAVDRLLVHGIDDALRSQAAVEAVSLFDAHQEGAHLHIDRSELARKLGEPPAETALFAPDGSRLVVWPADSTLPQRVDLPSPQQSQAGSTALRAGDADADAQPTTVETSEGAARELRLRVRAPDGATYLLLLRRSLAERDAALRAFAAVAVAALLAVWLTLFLAAGAQVRSLSGRVGRLVAHVAKVGAGQLDDEPPADDAGDEIAALRHSVAAATAARRDARDAEARLIADAAHELRTPLATMRLEVDLALRRVRDADALRATLERVGTEVDRLTAMTTALLDVEGASRDLGEQHNVDLRDVVKECVARAGAGPTPTLLPCTTPMPMRCDADAIGRAIDNLLANAARFARDRIEVSLRSGDGETVIAVEDDGPGVPPEAAEAIFAPFHRLQRDRDGAGLGLAIVRQTAARHGGSARVVRGPLGGARFELRLPASSSPQAV